jgi:membrane protein DedA with SNARE-associated domain
MFSNLFQLKKKFEVGAAELAGLFELLGILVFSFALNLIPFAGPSNLFIASNAALWVDADIFTVGFLVALGSATAKFIHYMVTFFLSGFMSQERRKRLDVAGLKVKRWATLALFVVAATPLPDEPVIIPLGLMKYSPVKVFSAYFAGKLLIGVVGAYFGQLSETIFASVLDQIALMALSIILTIVITVILLKVDVAKLMERVFKRKFS